MKYEGQYDKSNLSDDIEEFLKTHPVEELLEMIVLILQTRD